MKVRWLILLIIIVSVVAQATTVDFTPLSLYETTSKNARIQINNSQGPGTITGVEVGVNNIQITGAANYTEWTTSYMSDFVEWTGGTVETNVERAVFKFNFEADTVAADELGTVEIELNGIGETHEFNITILNDATAPNITSITPETYSRANNPSQNVRVEVTDDETDISSVTYSYDDCVGGPSTAVALTLSNSTYSGIADFTGYSEGDVLCYTITATNTPGEVRTQTGTLTFDGTAPAITLIAPTTHAIETTTFTFNATDNIATNLDCTLYIDNSTIITLAATNNTQTSTTQNLSGYNQGTHTWSVTCEDGVGLSATAVKTIIIDNSGPDIVTDLADGLPRTITHDFTATITDFSDVSIVNATFDGAVLTLTQNGTEYTASVQSNTTGDKVLIINAEDNHGQQTIYTKTLTFVPDHDITIDLSKTTVKPETTITVTGTLTADGAAGNTTVTITHPDGDVVATLNASDYTAQFDAPTTVGTYTITATYTENGYDYTAQETLTVRKTSTSDSGGGYSSGTGYDPFASNGVEPEEAPEPTEAESVSGGDNLEQPAQQQSSNNTPEPTYQPLTPEEPRQGVTPKATGIFDLGKTVAWSGFIFALALIGGLSVYSYRKPRTKGGINWDNYFNNGP